MNPETVSNGSSEANASSTSQVDYILAGIRSALIRSDGRFRGASIDLDTSLIDDLRLDSLRFVDLTVAIEDALRIREIPLQDWYDAELASESRRRFTVRSLVEVCARCIAERGEEGSGQ